MSKSFARRFPYNMRVLVLGAKGMLGQEIVREFIVRGHDVIGWDRDEIDVLSLDADEKIRFAAPDVLINCAAYNAVDLCETVDGWTSAEMLNGIVPGRLAKLAADMNAIFVHFSSDYVFDGENERGYTEDAVPTPVNEYGKSKLMGEAVVRASGANFFLIRLSRLFGKPASSIGAKKSFVDLMLELSAARDSFDLVDDEKSSPTYAPDLASAVYALIDDGAPYGIYHLANSGACTWYEFGDAVFTFAKKHVARCAVPATAYQRPASRPRFSELINTKRPQQRNWRDALAEYVRGR